MRSRTSDMVSSAQGGGRYVLTPAHRARRGWIGLRGGTGVGSRYGRRGSKGSSQNQGGHSTRSGHRARGTKVTQPGLSRSARSSPVAAAQRENPGHEQLAAERAGQRHSKQRCRKRAAVMVEEQSIEPHQIGDGDQAAGSEGSDSGNGRRHDKQAPSGAQRDRHGGAEHRRQQSDQKHGGGPQDGAEQPGEDSPSPQSKPDLKTDGYLDFQGTRREDAAELEALATPTKAGKKARPGDAALSSGDIAGIFDLAQRREEHHMSAGKINIKARYDKEEPIESFEQFALDTMTCTDMQRVPHLDTFLDDVQEVKLLDDAYRNHIKAQPELMKLDGMELQSYRYRWSRSLLLQRDKVDPVVRGMCLQRKFNEMAQGADELTVFIHKLQSMQRRMSADRCSLDEIKMRFLLGMDEDLRDDLLGNGSGNTLELDCVGVMQKAVNLAKKRKCIAAFNRGVDAVTAAVVNANSDVVEKLTGDDSDDEPEDSENSGDQGDQPDEYDSPRHALPWSEMTATDHANAQVLGWDADSWEEEQPCNIAVWADLSESQKEAAWQLDYGETEWDALTPCAGKSSEDVLAVAVELLQEQDIDIYAKLGEFHVKELAETHLAQVGGGCVEDCANDLAKFLDGHVTSMQGAEGGDFTELEL